MKFHKLASILALVGIPILLGATTVGELTDQEPELHVEIDTKAGLRAPPAPAVVGSLAIPFIENQGQTGEQVAYYLPTAAGMVFVTREGELVYSLDFPRQDEPGRDRAWVLTETLVGADPAPAGILPTDTSVSSFKGNQPKRWRTTVPTYAGVQFGEVYPGIHLELKSGANTVEKVFTVAPGSFAGQIRLRLGGHSALDIGAEGELVVGTEAGVVSFSAPVAWQEAGDTRIDVPVRWHIADNGDYGFQTGAYDRQRPLFIDPILQATYLGGSDDELGNVLVDPQSGDIFVYGETDSADFPGTTGGAQPTFAGGSTGDEGSGDGDGYIARLSGDLKTLRQVTYLGGSGFELMFDGMFSASGGIYVFGQTDSPDFPGATSGAQPSFGGGRDEFEGDCVVALLSLDLKTLVQSSYIGGSGDEFPSSMAMGSAGQVYVSGSTSSADLPGTAGGAQPAFGGGAEIGDTFVASFSGDLKTFNQVTYFGGSSDDDGNLAVNADHTPVSFGDGIYLVGSTTSANLPGTAGGFQPTFAGSGSINDDIFIANLSEDLSTLKQATYLGGSGNDSALLDNLTPDTGQLYVVGFTDSPNFPGTAGGAQPTYGGGEICCGDAVIALISADLKNLIQATYLGGSGDEGGELFAKVGGSIYIAGATSSPDLPGTSGGAQEALAGGFFSGDAYVARLSSDLTTLEQATYFGGSNDEGAGAGAGIWPALRNNGEVYLMGATSSQDLPGTAGGIQPSYGGDTGLSPTRGDGFIARFSPDLDTLLQATYFGGSGDDEIFAVRGDDGFLVEANGGFYVCGITTSADLPGVNGGAQETFGGNQSTFGGDAFLALLSPDLLLADSPTLKAADVVVDFGGIGLWARMNDASWLKLNNASPDQVTTGDVDGSGQDDVIAVFSSGIFIKRNLGGWSQLHNSVPQLITTGDLDNSGRDDVVIDFGGIGLWARMNDASWLQLNNASPEQVTTGDVDGNGEDDVIAVFSSGIFIKRNLGGWSQLHNFVPELITTGDLDNSGRDDVVIDFGGIGLWARMNDSSWLKLHNSSPGLIATGDLDGNGADDVLATFSGLGLWQKLNLGGWSKLNNSAPEDLVTGDVTANGQDDIMADFGNGIGGLFVKRDGGAWQKLHNSSPDSMATGNLDNL